MTPTEIAAAAKSCNEAWQNGSIGNWYNGSSSGSSPILSSGPYVVPYVVPSVGSSSSHVVHGGVCCVSRNGSTLLISAQPPP